MRKYFVLLLFALLLLSIQIPVGDSAREDAVGTRGENTPRPEGTTQYPWPMHLYDELHNAFTPAPAPASDTLLWFNTTGEITYSSPAVAEGLVFIGATDTTPWPWDNYMMAFYQDNGTLAWSTETTSQISGGEGFSSSPAYSNGYVVFGGDRIYCLYANNGTIKWTVSPGNSNYGDGTPTIADGKVFIGGSNRRLYNIDLETGTVLWTFQTQGGNPSNYGLYAAPAIYNGHAYLAACDGFVYQIRIDQPGPTASANHSYDTGYASYTSPVIFDNKVYIGNGYTFTRIENRFYALSAIDLSFVWEFYPGSATSFLSSAGIAYDTLFVGSVDGNLYALDPYGNGMGGTSVIWQYNIGPTWASPAISDSQVFIGSKWSYLYSFNAVQAGPPAYNWRYSMPGQVDSSAAIADGLLFVGTHGSGGRLYAFGQTGDITPPRAISYSPQGPGIDVNTDIVVQWSETMDWPSVESSFSFTDTITMWDATDGTFSHFFPTNTSTFDPSFSLDWGTTYWVTFSPSATDVAGNPLDGNGDGTGGDELTWPFTTVPDNPPVLALWDPGGSAGQWYTVGDTITIIWSASDDKPWPNSGNVVNLSYGPTPAGGISIAQFEQEDSSHPWDTSLVSPGTYYVNMSAYDSIGQTSYVSSAFSFDILPADSPPTVEAREPGGTSGQSYIVGTLLQIEWLVTDDNALPANNINITYGGGMTWNDVVRDTANDGVHTWDTSSVSPGTYSINVTAYDSIGQTSWDVGNFSFEMTAVPNLPPNATVLQPAGGESLSGGTLIDVIWTMEDDLTAVQDLVVNISYDSMWGSGPIDELLTGLASPAAIPWTLPLINATDVIVIVEVYDDLGESGIGFCQEFEIDSAPPTVMWTNPTDGQSNVPRNTNIEAQWSEGMNQSATEASFQLLDNSTWLPVPGAMSWIGNSFIFNPDSDLAGDNWYTANFTTLARDDSNPGNPLAGTYSWSFRTTPIPDTTPPEISDVQAPSPQEVHFNVNVSAIVTDDFSVGVVTLNVTGPSGNWNLSMSYDSGRYYLDATYDEIGTHFFTIFATDSSGNSNSSSGQFLIVDTTPPELSNLTVIPSTPEVFTSANVSIEVQDNYQLQGVWIDITGMGNYSMGYDSASGKYYDERAYSTLGTIDFWVWASDTSGNWNGASGSLLVEDRTPPLISHTPVSTWSAFAPLPIQATVTESFLQNVRLDFVDVNSVQYNVSMTYLGGSDFEYTVPAQGSAGVLTYFIWATDTSANEARTQTYVVNIILDDNPPGVSDVDASPSPQEVYGDVTISATVVDDYGLQSVSVEITWPDTSTTNDSMSAGAGDTYSFTSSYDQLGYYPFTIWASDTSEKWASSAGSFSIVDSTPPTITHTPLSSRDVGEAVNLNATVTDNHDVAEVRVQFTDTSGIPRNESMAFTGGNDYFFAVGAQPQPGIVTYFFWATDSSGNVAMSPSYTIQIGDIVPNPPENLTVVSSLRTSLRLSWNPPTTNVDGSPLTDLQGYNLYRATELGGQMTRVNSQLIAQTSYLDENLRTGTTYYYVVRAVNSQGMESVDSNQASGTTLKPQVDDYTWLIILIIIIIVAAIIILLLRRRKGEEEPYSEQM